MSQKIASDIGHLNLEDVCYQPAEQVPPEAIKASRVPSMSLSTRQKSEYDSPESEILFGRWRSIGESVLFRATSRNRMCRDAGVSRTFTIHL
jgi:hypothetical protein